MQTSKVLFIAGGTWQKPFIQYLKNKGHFVAVVNPNVTPATSLADYHIKCDINDLDEINKHISFLNPVFITSDQSDISTLTVARLSEKWNLPGNGVDVTDRFTNKFSIYSFAKKVGTPVPETALVNNLDEIRQFVAVYGYPIIIKPTDATMSRGFRKLESDADVTEEHLRDSRKFSKSGQVIVQTFIPGEMVTLEGVCSGGRHRTVATSKKNGYFKPGITSGVRYPSNLSQAVLDEIVAVNDQYVEEAGMKFGLTHSEYIVNVDGFTLIEIGGRGGGAGITNKIVPWVSGINPYDLLYNSLMGHIVDVKQLTLLSRPALLKYYTIDEVANCTLEKAERIQQLQGVAEFNLDFIGKQYVSDLNDSRHTMGIYVAETHAEIQMIVDSVSNIFRE